MNHDEGEQSLSRILDGVWQSIQNSNKKGVSDWVSKVRAAANKARDLEKRNRELENFVSDFSGNFDACEECNNGLDATGDTCRACHGTTRRLVSFGVLYVDLQAAADALLNQVKK